MDLSKRAYHSKVGNVCAYRETLLEIDVVRTDGVLVLLIAQALVRGAFRSLRVLLCRSYGITQTRLETI